MSILDTIRKQINPKQGPKNFSFRSLVYSPSETPKIVEKPNCKFVWWGETNLYPHQLFDLKYGSPIHNSILKTKAKMMAGDGLLFNTAKTKEESDNIYNGFQGTTKIEVDHILNNKYGGHKLEDLQDLLAQDFQDYGAYCFKRVYNNNFTKIAAYKYVKVDNIRPGKMEDGKVKVYYYHEDWTKHKRSDFNPTPIYAYDENDKEHTEQLVYRKVGNMDYFGIPSYSGALTWIHTDVQMGIFHKSNIENGMNPGLHFKFYRKPASIEEEDRIIYNLDREYKSAMNAGRRIISFNDGKDDAMEIAPVEISNLDKQLLLLAELCDQKILTGHQLTTPILAGITSKGFTSGGAELLVGYQIFDGVAMASDRKVLANDIQEWFTFNNTGVKVEINKFKPFEDMPQQKPQFTISQNG